MPFVSGKNICQNETGDDLTRARSIGIEKILMKHRWFNLYSPLVAMALMASACASTLTPTPPPLTAVLSAPTVPPATPTSPPPTAVPPIAESTKWTEGVKIRLKVENTVITATLIG